MPAWIDAFVNAHSSPAALAIVDEYLAATELSDDVRRKVLQSRDGLLRAVRVRAAFATAPEVKARRYSAGARSRRRAHRDLTPSRRNKVA